jgi:hypothetical protein
MARGRCIAVRLIPGRQEAGDMIFGFVSKGKTEEKRAFKVAAFADTERMRGKANLAFAKLSFRKDWPGFKYRLRGRNTLTVVNPNRFRALVGIRAAGRGIDFHVAPMARATVLVPNGRFEAYFHFSDRPGTVHRGDSFSLQNQNAEIRVVQIPSGNYGIRPVK